MKTLEEFDFSKSASVPSTLVRDLAGGGYIKRVGGAHRGVRHGQDSRRDGTRRRIAFADVREYKQQRRAARVETFVELTAQAQELGMGYE
jgi:hypothetical protein